VELIQHEKGLALSVLIQHEKGLALRQVELIQHEKGLALSVLIQHEKGLDIHPDMKKLEVFSSSMKKGWH
jgi:hypothetical protein